LKLTKAQRATLAAMFDGRCAYCGELLGARWHADHKEPIMRGYKEKSSENPHGAWHAHRDTIDNLMPACAPCNLDKATHSLDQWRRKLEGSAASLARYSSTYRHAFRFGLVKPVLEHVTFHFERVAAEVRP
jgi:5-methylcytosine-specific restriction endonuclease McrA